MIFDPEIELANIETQPEWIGVQIKVEQLQKKRSELMARFEQFKNDKILSIIDEVDQDLILFQNIMAFWIRNYQKMESLYNSFQDSIKEINKGASQLNLINDLKQAHKYEHDENVILSQVFIELAENKGMDAAKMKSSLDKLRSKVNEYWKSMIKQLDE